MAKIAFKPGNMLYPLPAVMVSVADREGRSNIITVAWAGTICTDPPMVSISVKPSRYSHHMILETGGFVVNLTTKELARAADHCGVRSGRDVDKWKETGLTPFASDKVAAPGIAQCPVNIECRVVKREQLGSHDMFMAEVVAVHVDDRYMDERGSFRLDKASPVVYSHGEYYALGAQLGRFGYSVRQKDKAGRSGTARKRDKRH